MDGPDKPPSLKDFTSRLRKAQKAYEPLSPGGRSGSNLGVAMRVAIEMVAAFAVGGVMGWLLDGWLGTRPWLLLVFLFVGAAAGIRNAYRVASRLNTSEPEDTAGRDETPPRES